MSMQDPISDMLTRLRNAGMSSQKEVVMPASKMKAAIAKVLLDEGYIAGFHVDGLGIAILSSPKGVLSGKDAQKQNVGGEVLCYVW